MRSAPAPRLALAVTGYLVLMIAIITLAPFRFAAAPLHEFTSDWGLRDLLLNIALFVPLGFALQLGRERGSDAAWVPALLLGALISGIIESAQVFLPDRFPSVADLITNAIGAAVGAVIAARATRRLDGARTVRAFALDLPLVGLIYLLVPLLWLCGLSLEPGEATLLLLPTAAVAWIIASVHAAYVDPSGAPGVQPLLRPAMGGALFIAVAFLPALSFAPLVAPAASLLFAVVVAVRLRAPVAWTHERLADGTASRRFEGPTLRLALVPLVVFAALHALWPLDAERTPWRATLALLPIGVEPDDRVIFRVMAHASVFTVLGYAIAELGARASDSVRALAPRVVARALLLALPLEILRGWRAGSVASALVLAISVGAALFGAWLFVLQLQNVRALLGRGADR